MALKSWIESANEPGCDFPIENLPYGVFHAGDGDRIGVAIGNRILDLRACSERGLLDGIPDDLIEACSAEVLNPLMGLGQASWSELRRRITALLDAGQAEREAQSRVSAVLVPMKDAEMRLPAAIGDYTDFYASIHHATRVGELFRPQNPLLPNYKYVPIGYHGRASSIVVSGTEIRRPRGQIKPKDGEPAFGASQSLDYELEVGFFVGPGNELGNPIPVAEAESHIFGLCLVNDWSARDIQSWEYQPLGPFLAKNFATTISPWVVPLEALARYRVPAFARPEGDPAPLNYLQSPSQVRDGIDLHLEVYLQSAQMRETGTAPCLLGRSNLRHLYWTLAQLLAHHSSNGCNLRPGDLLATGTVSGPDAGSEGCLLEKQRSGEPVCLPNGEVRKFLHDADRVTLRAFCGSPGLPRIGLGECSGTISPG
ncbi:MAG TPA: fumarylacetoacetase [Terracidiphilus sp.]|nr:fumarylacetoacetase [Terracidiphilus sp.]